MKIHDLNSLNQLISTGTGTARRAAQGAPASFRDTLSALNRGNAMEKLTEMSVNLSRQGELLGRRCDILELKRYKEMLAEYMHEAVRFMYEFKKQSGMDGRGRHKIYAIIKSVNKKLEELTREILSSQANQLEIMAAIDEIRGMLLDMLL